MNQQIIQKILSSIEKVRFGSVEVIIHNSKVVQVEIKRNIRFDQKDVEEGSR